MTQITLHQGYFGEVDKAHGCIDSNFEHNELNNFLKTFTDRPIEMPAGVMLNTYFSGVAKHGYYIFTKTFLDTSSSRGGMVFTHALLVRQDDLSQINNLQSLFDYFVDEIPELRQLEEIPVTIESTVVSLTHTQTLAYVQKTLEAITDQKLPAVFCGDMTTFIDTLSIIWAGLSMRLRQKFQFGVRFTPDSIKDEKDLTLAYVQEDMQEQWVNYSATIISSQHTQKVEITSLAQQLLLDAHQNNPLKAFIDELAVELDTFQLYHKCENIYSNYESLGTLPALQTTRLLRQVIELSPKPENGQSVKSKILTQIAQLIKDGQYPQIQSLRNIDLQMVNDGEEILSQAIKHYINALFTGGFNFEKESVLKWVKFIKEDSSQQWWVEVVSVTIRDNIVAASDTPTQNTWQLIQDASEQAVSLTTLFEYIPTNHSQEGILLKHLPKMLSQDIVSQLVPIIAQRNWYLLHAHCLLQHQTTHEALLAQLELEKSLSIKDSIGAKWIEDKLTDNELLTLAIANGEQKLMEYAAQRVIKNPTLLTNLDVLNSHWLELWALVLHQTKNLTLGIDNLQAKIHQIYDQVVARVQIPEIILNLLSDSPQADLTNYPQQSQLLVQLPLPLKQKFIATTIEAYLDALIKGRLINVSLDSAIRQQLTSGSYINKALSSYKNDIDKAITVYDHFGLLSDNFLSNYIQSLYAVALPIFQSNYLGKAISDRGYTKSARKIFDKAKINDTFKPAFEQCKHLIKLKIWDFLYLDWFGNQALQYSFSQQEAYQELANLVTQLYPQGPEQSNIWAAAGGDIAKLKNQNSRQENWQEAIRLLQNGGGGRDITISSLLEAMSSEYSNNDKLKALIQFFKS